MGKKIFSGVQPTGNLHLGNYLGAIKNFVELNNDNTNECIFCVVDLHAITVKQDPKELKKNIRETVATFIASGIDPNKSVYIRFSQNYLTSNNDFSHIRSSALVKQSRTILKDEVNVSAAFEFGHLSQIEGKSRVTDRFTTFSRQMRGFKAAGIGPRDLYSTNKDPLGGQYFAVARFESDFSLGVPEEYGMRAAVFLDAGSVWGLDNRTGTSGSSQPGGLVDDKFYLRSTLGAGRLWSPPIGPLRFDFTKAIKKESYDQPESFNFSLSTKF